MAAGLQITGWPAHDSPISSLLFGHDETTIFTLGSDGKVCNHVLTNLSSSWKPTACFMLYVLVKRCSIIYYQALLLEIFDICGFRYLNGACISKVK